MSNRSFYAHPMWHTFAEEVAQETGISFADAAGLLRENWNPTNIRQSIQDAIESVNGPLRDRGPVIQNWGQAVNEVVYQTRTPAVRAATALGIVWNSGDIYGSINRAILLIRGPINKG